MVNVRLEAMTLVATDITAMATFYAGAFGVEFEEIDIGEGKIQAGEWLGTEFVLVPQSISECKAEDNRMHFDLFVDDIHALIEAVESSGGKTNGQLADTPEMFVIGIYDPDGNFMVVKQLK